jgi:hypothetical protein
MPASRGSGVILAGTNSGVTGPATVPMITRTRQMLRGVPVSAPGRTRTCNPWFRRSERADYFAALDSKQTLGWKGFRIIAAFGVILLTFQILWQIASDANRFRAEFRAIIFDRIRKASRCERPCGSCRTEFQEWVGHVEKHQCLLAASLANPEELDECALANWTFSTGSAGY